MSRGGEVGPIQWGDAEYTFRLGIGEQRKVQERCDAGISEIAARLSTLALALSRDDGKSMRQLIGLGYGGTFRVDDVREVVLRGLVGGGMTENDAAAIVRERIDDQLDFKSGVVIAYAACMAALCGPEDEPLGESPAGAPKKKRSRAASSGTRASTRQAPQ